jgi:hypothetical protein
VSSNEGGFGKAWAKLFARIRLRATRSFCGWDRSKQTELDRSAGNDDAPRLFESAFIDTSLCAENNPRSLGVRLRGDERYEIASPNPRPGREGWKEPIYDGAVRYLYLHTTDSIKVKRYVV